ncbi:MAG: hypothetical protein JRJ65_05940 [Deltaproteobacteria bacterium]|nr:hypothetical protein [Deltaproteobacteria bacterium]
MPLIQKKIVSIISDQCKNLDEKCRGYRDQIFNTVADILVLERQHRIRSINIQQKINDKCVATGRFLAENISPDQ